MKEHIHIITLLDFAQDRITDDTALNNIADHLADCAFCRRIISSHFDLIENHDEIIDKLFPNAPSLAIDEVFQLVSSKLAAVKKRLGSISGELITEIRTLLQNILTLPGYEIKIIPVTGETYGTQDQAIFDIDFLRFTKPEIPVRISLPEGFNINDFIIEFNLKSLYVIYEKPNYTKLLNLKVELFTVLWSPFIFETSFIEDADNKYAMASITVEDKDIFQIPELAEDEEIGELFFLSIK